MLVSVSAMLPPNPRKRHRPVHGPTSGDGAARLIAKAPKAPPLANYNRLLVWDWRESPGNYWSNTVFLVRSSANLKDWSAPVWTPTNYWLFYINLDNTSMFFTVSASNTATHLVSE